MGTHVALLRGINVGGKNSVPMKTLAKVFERSGCRDVRTYIQSGNVVFTAARIPKLAEAIEREFGFAVPVVVRTAEALREVSRANPFVKKSADTDRFHVVFLASEPTKAQIATLDPARSPPDEFAVRGHEVYLRCPNGVGQSKLTNAWFDSKLKTTSTMRNWRTVLALVELCLIGARRSS